MPHFLGIVETQGVGGFGLTAFDGLNAGKKTGSWMIPLMQLDNFRQIEYIAKCEYMEALNEILSQSYESSFRSESGENH